MFFFFHPIVSRKFFLQTLYTRYARTSTHSLDSYQRRTKFFAVSLVGRRRRRGLVDRIILAAQCPRRVSNCIRESLGFNLKNINYITSARYFQFVKNIPYYNSNRTQKVSKTIGRKQSVALTRTIFREKKKITIIIQEFKGIIDVANV